MRWENQTEWEYKHCGDCGEELQDPSEKAFDKPNGYAIISFYSEEHGKINHKMCDECHQITYGEPVGQSCSYWFLAF